jgi:cyclopropane-fatty-acyl-phospholipid synthase
MTMPGNILTGSRARRLPATFSLVVAAMLRHYLRAAQIGTLTVTLPSGVTMQHRGAHFGPDAVLVMRRWRALRRMIAGGSLGLARAYMDDDCGSPDIKALLDFGMQNEEALVNAAPGSRRARILERLRLLSRSNTRHGSRRNIAAHYDLGNDFYAQWLDRGMNYSSALFTSETQTLEQAQDAKLDRIVDLLDVAPGQDVLEIGCGWGPLAEHLTARHDCHVTGLTLSAEQLAFARARLRLAPGAECDLRLQDYRDVEGRYDRIASIEMVEAVGERYWPTYFHKLRQSLTDTGIAVLQAITIVESRFENYRRRPDFIQRYVFPGGMLPTLDIIRREAGRAGLSIAAHESFGASYARTLAEWRRRFALAWPEIETQGFDSRFRRMWEYYLAYCEVGFQAGAIDVSLLKLVPAR